MNCERQIPYAVMNWRSLIEARFLRKIRSVAEIFFARHRDVADWPDAETLAQARRYRDSLPARPGWNHAVETAFVEVYGDIGYKWFPVRGVA